MESRTDSDSSEDSYDSEEEKRRARKSRQEYQKHVRKDIDQQMRRLNEYRKNLQGLRDFDAEMSRLKIEMEWREAWTFEGDVNEREKRERAARAASALDREMTREGNAGKHSNASSLWKEHESKWSSFANASRTKVGVDSIPWPPCSKGTLSGMAATLLETSIDDTLSVYEAHRKAYKQASLRWHPDKFLHKFGCQIQEQEREEVLARVQHISQCINDAWDEIRGREPS